MRQQRQKRAYGIVPGQYEFLKTKQQVKCASCKEIQIPNKICPDLVVDHNHHTKKIRGLLCSHCNLALGHLKDDFSKIIGLAKYLQEAEGII